jgi:hypothetical protein
MNERKAMLTSQTGLSVTRQCQLLAVPRSSAYARGSPALLDRVAAKLSYNEVVNVMPLVSSRQGRTSEDERDYKPHPVFVHRKSNEAVFGGHG